MINKDVKGQLARLLATENIMVEHRNVSTASFDVEKRLLLLPMWETASQDIYDLLVGHEVGHALFTPATAWEEMEENRNLPKFFVNVTEDARIEKLMKRKYPGLSRNFYRGYQELHEQDFFGVADEPEENLSFIDKVNLHFKVGIHTLTQFNFTEEEKYYIDLVANAETFEEAVSAAREIHRYAKSANDEFKTLVAGISDNTDNPGENSETSNGVQDVTQDSEDNSQSKSEENNNDNPESSSDSTTSSEKENVQKKPVNQLESKTDKAWEQNQEKLLSKNPYSPRYISIPEVDVEELIIDSKEFYDTIEDYYGNYVNLDISADRKKRCLTKLLEVSKEYLSYRKESQKEVSYLVKEFEMKKAADSYNRSATARTGVLDTSKLHSYKYNEDIFKRVSVVPNSKNHGMIFVLDWSGSMCNDIHACIKQVLNLCWFCKKVGIPFEVYAFSDNGSLADTFDEYKYKLPEVDNTIHIESNFRLVNLLSSKYNNVEFERQAKWLYTVGYAFSYYGHYNLDVPDFVGLAGTPLNEAVVCYNSLIPYFQRKHKVQKLSIITLTDGDASPTLYCKPAKDYPGSVYAKHYYSRISVNTVLVNQKTKRHYSVNKYDDYYLTRKLLENVKDIHPDVTLIGIRLVYGSTVRSYVNRFVDYNTVSKNWSTNKCIVINNSGYDALYVIPNGNALSETTEFDVEDGASKTQIKSAFRKMLKKKALNKKFLTTFIESVA